MKINPFSMKNLIHPEQGFELIDDEMIVYLLNNNRKYWLDRGLLRLKALELILKQYVYLADIDQLQGVYREITGENLPVYRVELLEFDEKMGEN